MSKSQIGKVGKSKLNSTERKGFSPIAQIVVVFVLTLLVYSNSFRNELIVNWDDYGYIVENEVIHSLNAESVKEIFSSFYMSNYHPFTTLSYAIEYALVQDNVLLYHIDNLLLHLLNALLVFVFINSLYRKPKSLVPFVVSLLFAIHPMHVESVAWISERKDVLYTFFFLLGLIFYLRFLRNENKKTSNYLLLSLFFIASLMSKSAAVVFPVILFVIDWYEKRKFSFRLILEKVPLLLLSILFGILAIESQESAMQDLNPLLSFFERLLIVNFSFLTYLWKLFLPINLSAMYPYPLKVNDMLPIIYYILPIVTLALIYALYRFRKNKEFVFGTAFFLISIALVLQLVPVGGTIVSERYTYVPYIGLLFILASFFEKILQGRRFAAILLIAVPTLCFSLQSFDRVSYWKNGDVLFSDVIEKYPRFPYAYNNRAFLYWDYYAQKIYKDNPARKELFANKAYADYTMSISLDRNYHLAWCNRAVLLYNTGKVDQALSDFNEVLRLKPDFKDALLGRANTLSTLGRFEESLADYNKYLDLFPDDSKAWLWRGIAKCNLKDYDNSLLDIEQSLSLDELNHESWYWKGMCNYYLGNFDLSLTFFDKCISLKNDYVQVYAWKGLALQNLKEYQKSIDVLSEAISLNPSDYSSYVNRAISYYHLDDFTSALNDLDTAGRAGFPLNKDFYFAVVNKDRSFLK